jgi:biopolymer transport protein ExbD
MSLKPKRRRPEINIVPLIDVLAILIFFFLMTMQFRELQALNLVLPQIETAGAGAVDESLVIGIDAEGAFFIDGNRVEREELTAFLAELRPVAREVSVLLMADENTPLREVTFVMDQVRRNGIDRIRLQSR